MDDEPRADDAAVRAGTVLGADIAAMRLDDLPGDGQAEAGIAAEGRALGPGGVEPLEDRLEIVRRDAGAVVLDRSPRWPVACRRG
jgi:hypothetical protein